MITSPHKIYKSMFLYEICNWKTTTRQLIFAKSFLLAHSLSDCQRHMGGNVQCSMFVSLLSHFWRVQLFFPPIPALSTISRPLSMSMYSITPANVGRSYNRMRGPGIGCWFSDRSNCSHWSLTLTLTMTSENRSLYATLLLLLVLIQLCSPRCWHLDSNYCCIRCRQSQLRFVLSPLLLHPRLLGTFQSDIPLFTLTWPAKHSPNQGWESTHRLHIYPLGGVFCSP